MGRSWCSHIPTKSDFYDRGKSKRVSLLIVFTNGLITLRFLWAQKSKKGETCFKRLLLEMSLFLCAFNVDYRVCIGKKYIQVLYWLLPSLLFRDKEIVKIYKI